MSTFEKKEVLLQTIGELFHKMDNGNLSKTEMQILVENARQLYDRAVIMQYKALEANVLETTDEVKPAAPVQEKIEEPKTPEPVKEEQPTIDFSIFDQAVEEEPKIEFETPTTEETIAEEPKIEPTEARTESIPAQSAEIKSFYEKFSNSSDNSLSSQFGSTKLESLKNAFGFNEKLQVIGELFDGDSNSFNTSIDSLDSASSADSARQILSELAVKHSWDLENQLTESFVNKVERRHV